MLVAAAKYDNLSNRHVDALRRVLQADAALERTSGLHQRFSLEHSGEGPYIHHDGWDRSWAVPDGTTIDDLGELGLLRVEPSINKTRAFDLSMDGRRYGESIVNGEPVLVEAVSGSGENSESDSSAKADDPNAVAVMHGRDAAVRDAVFDMLRRWGLNPLEWDDLVDRTGSGAPYNGEAVEVAFREAQAVVVVVTPDDVGYLHPELRGEHEEESDRQPTGQPRLNVVLEAGMALQSHPTRTIFLELGRTRKISDLGGRNVVRLDGKSVKPFESLKRRLTTAGCFPDRSGQDDDDRTAFTDLDAFHRTREAETVSTNVPPNPEIALREIKTELDSTKFTLERATSSSRWWSVGVLLGSGKWHEHNRQIATHKKEIYDVIARAYVDVDQANKALGEEIQLADCERSGSRVAQRR